jgi:hypothetical protein
MDDKLVGVKQWKCPQGHVLGMVERAEVRQGHVSRLLLFRQAVDRDSFNPAMVDVMAVVEGTALEIRCSVCGEVRPWYIGADAMERLLEKVGGSDHANQER